jgi:hypothetical protein
MKKIYPVIGVAVIGTMSIFFNLDILSLNSGIVNMKCVEIGGNEVEQLSIDKKNLTVTTNSYKMDATFKSKEIEFQRSFSRTVVNTFWFHHLYSLDRNNLKLIFINTFSSDKRLTEYQCSIEKEMKNRKI